jgi:hypothetical protein
MAQSPVPYLIILSVGIIMQALLTSSGEVDTPDIASSFEEEDPDAGGFFSQIEALLTPLVKVWDFVVGLFGFLTFNIDGIPWYIRTILNLPLITGVGWSIATLIRGN